MGHKDKNINKKIFKDLIFKIKIFKKTRYFIIFILFTVLTLILLYNSCAYQSIETIKFPKILSSFLQDFRVEIKNGDYSTKTLENIPLNFKVPTKNLRGEAIDYEMKISQTPDCSSGEWEPYQEEATWTFQSDEEEEKLLFIYVKFREKEVNYTLRNKDLEETQGESKCIYDSIVHDTIPPRNLKLSYKPAKKTNQKKAEFRFTAKDYSPIQFQCRLHKPELNSSPPNSEEVLWSSCASGISYDFSHFEEEGEYTFYLRAKDLSGNTSEEILEYSWTIDRTAPSLSFSSCPQDLNASASAPTSILVESNNLTFPVSLYCENNQEQFESCGTIDSPQATVAIDPSYSIEERLTNDYYKKTLNIKAIDPSGNFSEPIECIWYVDTGFPTVNFVTPTPESSYGTSTNPYVHQNPFTIEVSDNSLQTDHTQSDAIEIEYKVYQCDQSLPICNQNQQDDSWRRLDINNSTTTEIISEDPLKLKFHITQGLKPGINTANKHKIEIRVKDAVGNISKTPLPTATWDVYGQVEEVVSTQSTSSGKADILFVLDDSGSLSIIAQYLGNSFSGIISSLGSLNWQIAVTSMERLNPSDSREQRAKDDGFKGIKNFGHLVQLIDNSTDTFLRDQYILSPNPQTTCTAPSLYCSSNTSKLKDIFKRTITIKRDQGYQPIGDNNFTFYGNSEYGIQSVNVLLDYYDNQGRTSAAITELTDYTPPSTNEINAIQSFFRDDSTFVVIFITDEQNCGQGTSTTDCHKNAQTNINHPQNLIGKVKTIFGDDKKFISYPIIPKPGEGYPYDTDPTTGYPEEDQDDYLKLAKATQGREGKNSSNPVIWVDVDYNQSSRTSRSDTTCPDNTNLNRRVYKRDLCAIGEDILRLTTRAIQLNCTPITENLEDTAGIHPPKYFYSPPTNPTSFTALNKDSNGSVLIGNVQVTIDESWVSSSTNNDINRVTLKGQSGNDIPIGNYKVVYYCYSDEISSN